MSILSFLIVLGPLCPFSTIYVHFVEYWAIFSTDLEVGISHWYTNGIRGISVQNLNQFTKASKFTQNHSGHVWLTLWTTGLQKLWMMQSHATRFLIGWITNFELSMTLKAKNFIISFPKRLLFTYTNNYSPLLGGSNFGFPDSNRFFPGQ